MPDKNEEKHLVAWLLEDAIKNGKVIEIPSLETHIEQERGWADGVCDDPDHPEYHGQPCDCAGCRPENVCINEFGGCSECNGPSQGCSCGSEEDEEDNEIENMEEG